MLLSDNTSLPTLFRASCRFYSSHGRLSRSVRGYVLFQGQLCHILHWIPLRHLDLPHQRLILGVQNDPVEDTFAVSPHSLDSVSALVLSHFW